MTDNPSRFDGKVAWITGSGRGMGRAHAEMMAARGADIVLHDVLQEEVAAVAETVRALGRRVIVSTASVTDLAAMRALVGEAERELGSIDILVNNAGIMVSAALRVCLRNCCRSLGLAAVLAIPSPCYPPPADPPC